MSIGFLLYQGMMWPTISYHDDGNCSKTDVHNQILVVTWLGPNLKNLKAAANLRLFFDQDAEMVKRDQINAKPIFKKV